MIMKICIVCSQGGHLTQSLQLLEAYSKYEYFFVTYHSIREEEIKKIAPAYFIENISTSIFRMVKASFNAFRILNHERPDVIISLGSEIAIPFFYLAKVFGMKTIFIESWSRINDGSLTGKLVYPVSNVFWVQWPQLLKVYGPKAQYKGAII